MEDGVPSEQTINEFLMFKLKQQFELLDIEEDDYTVLISKVVSKENYIREIRFFNPRMLAMSLYLLGDGEPSEMFENEDKLENLGGLSIKVKSTLLRYARVVNQKSSS